jgi:predicted ribosomally synthesized peptide with nif11-like leader
MEEKLIKLQAKLEANQSLAEKLFALETPGEVQSFLKEQGLEFSLDEINTFKDALIKAATKPKSGELSDEDLEDVAGGSAGTALDKFINGMENLVIIGGRRW